MADGEANPQKKTYTNKNIKKLRVASMVCSLTSSWQKWVTDNETKQASEPSGWSPSWMGDSDKEPKKTWKPKKITKTQSKEDVKKQDNRGENVPPAEKPMNEEPKKIWTPEKITQNQSGDVKKQDNAVDNVLPDEKPMNEEPKKTWTIKEFAQNQSEDVKEQDNAVDSVFSAENLMNEEPTTTWTPEKITQNQSGEDVKEQDNYLDVIPTEKLTEEDDNISEPVVASPIKTKQVAKTIKTVAKEKSIGIGVLTEKITKESLPSNEEIDRLLKKKSSPTRRRKCSNMVSSLTKSWKQVERTATEGTGARDREILNTEVHKEQAQVDGKRKDLNDGTQKEEEEEEEESAVMIKRPSMSLLKKESEDAQKINALSKSYSAVGSLKSRWQNWASEHTVNQKLNPFSEYFDYDYSMSTRLQKGQEGYGRPKEGSKTAERAKRAEKHIHREIDDMCLIIRTMADPDPDGRTRVTFGELFERYVRISDKVVGILMRARKHGKLEFEGEMLWQGRDDGVVITLLV